MIVPPKTWLYWATKLMPRNRSDWLSAMEVELKQISNPKDQMSFTFGCFKTAMTEWARSRKGLSFITRLSGAFFLSVLSIYGIYAASQMRAEPEMFVASKLIAIFCMTYMCCAVLLLISLRALKATAIIGLGTTLSGFTYSLIANPYFEGLSREFVMALNLEAAVLMATIYFLTLYLGWLYTPEYDNA